MTAVAAGLRTRRRSALGGLVGYVARRLVSAALVVLVVSFVVFGFVHAAPGGPEQSIAGRFATAGQLAAIRKEYKLDEPVWTQYLHFLSSAAHLDFGTSYSMREPVLHAIGDAAGVTVPLVLAGWGFAVVLGSLLGIATAYRSGGPFDRSVLGLTVIGASSPMFATAILLSYVFGVELGWVPTLGEGAGGVDRIRHLMLPAITLAIAAIASISKVTKVRVEQVLEEDHVTFADARGLSRRRVLCDEVLRNSAVQLVTQAGAVLVSLISAVIVVENVFDLNGVGSLLLRAIAARDIPLIQAITLLTAVFIVVINLIVDVLCMVIDPRTRSEAGGRR